MATSSIFNHHQSHSYLGLSSLHPTAGVHLASPPTRVTYSPASSPPSPRMATPQLHFSPTSPMSYASVRSVSPYLSSADRDLEIQRRILGYDAFESAPASPSHHFKPTSPLSEASNLEDELDADLLDSDRSPAKPASLILEPFARPALVRNFSSIDNSEDDLTTPPSSALGLAFSAPNKPLSPIVVEELRSARTRTASPLLPTIQETTWPYGGTLFPHAPPPPPPEPFKPREHPSPHIVDIAIETYGLPAREPFVMYTPPASPPNSQQRRRKSWNIFRKSPSLPPAEEEKQPDIWSVWDAERLRAAEMTREAAKDNFPEWQEDSFTRGSGRPSFDEEQTISRVSSGSHNDEPHLHKGSRFFSTAKLCATRIKNLSRTRERS